jgi:hypothetical protein
MVPWYHGTLASTKVRTYTCTYVRTYVRTRVRTTCVRTRYMCITCISAFQVVFEIMYVHVPWLAGTLVPWYHYGTMVLLELWHNVMFVP